MDMTCARNWAKDPRGHNCTGTCVQYQQVGCDRACLWLLTLLCCWFSSPNHQKKCGVFSHTQYIQYNNSWMDWRFSIPWGWIVLHFVNCSVITMTKASTILQEERKQQPLLGWLVLSNSFQYNGCCNKLFQYELTLYMSAVTPQVGKAQDVCQRLESPLTHHNQACHLSHAIWPSNSHVLEGQIVNPCW